jgi:hypothetical protein
VGVEVTDSNFGLGSGLGDGEFDKLACFVAAAEGGGSGYVVENCEPRHA